MSSETTAVTPKLYIAIDIHKHSWKVQSATDLSLGPHFTAPPDASHLKTWVSNHFPDYQVHLAYEAGCCGYEPARDFLSYGWNTIVSCKYLQDRNCRLSEDRSHRCQTHL